MTYRRTRPDCSHSIGYSSQKFAVTCYALNARVALQRKSDRGCVIVPATNYISRRRRLDDVLKYRASAKILYHMIQVISKKNMKNVNFRVCARLASRRGSPTRRVAGARRGEPENRERGATPRRRDALDHGPTREPVPSRHRHRRRDVRRSRVPRRGAGRVRVRAHAASDEESRRRREDGTDALVKRRKHYY